MVEPLPVTIVKGPVSSCVRTLVNGWNTNSRSMSSITIESHHRKPLTGRRDSGWSSRRRGADSTLAPGGRVAYSWPHYGHDCGGDVDSTFDPTRLRDQDLLRTDLFVDGRWTPGETGRRADVTDPATGTVIATMAQA